MDKGKQVFESVKGAAAAGAKMPSGSGRAIGAAIKAVAAAVAVGYAGYNAFFNVEGGHRAVVYNRLFGLKDAVYAEGTHLLVPWLERPVIYDVRTRPRTMNTLTGSRDLQMVSVHLRILSKPNPAQLPDIHRRLGPNFDEKVLPSIVNEVLKQVVAKFTAAELLTQREAVSRKIKSELMQRAEEFNLQLEDVSITDLTFGQDFTAAVEAKQVAQQDAERARFIVDKAKQEKRSIVIRAQGEARAAKLIGEAINDNPGFIELRRLEAARDIATIVAASQNRVYLNADSLLLSLQGSSGIDERLRSTTQPKSASEMASASAATSAKKAA